MTRGARAFCLSIILLSGAGGAAQARSDRQDPTTGIDDERDALIGKITDGVDYDASVKRFRELADERDKLVPTLTATIEREHTAEQTRYRLRDEYEKTADYHVGERCRLSPDPAHPVVTSERLVQPEAAADWGRVTRKEKARRPGKTQLDPDEIVTMFEVAGVARSYRFTGKGFGHARDTDFDAELGELALVCVDGTDDNGVVTRGLAVRLAEPPLVAKKGRWAPYHVLNRRFFYDVLQDVKWPLPPAAFIFTNVVISKDLGGGRYEIVFRFYDDHTWVLEVPPSVKVKEPLTTGQVVWAVMGHHRFDKALRKLVLVAEDLEPRYIKEKR